MTPNRAVCSSCGAAILWTRSSASGKPIPLDPDPVPTGNIVLLPVSGDAHYLRRGAAPSPASTPRYVSHFATCPFAERHRRRP